MGDVVNLRMARKARARSKAAREAESNRAKFGLGKAERETTRRESERTARTLELAKRESGKGKPD